MYPTWPSEELCAMLGQRVRDPLSLLHPTPVGTDSDRAVSSLVSRFGQKKQERWEEAVNSIDRWKIPTPGDHRISEPFRPEELAAAVRRLNPGKSRGLDSIFPEFILHTGSALKSWFYDFLASCMRQLKIPNIWRRALIVAIPKPEKPLGHPKSYRPYPCCVSLLKSSRDSSTLVSTQSSTLCSLGSRRAFDTRGRP